MDTTSIDNAAITLEDQSYFLCQAGSEGYRSVTSRR